MTTGELAAPAEWQQAAWVVREISGKRARVFAASMPVSCHNCHQAIATGEYFSSVLLSTRTDQRGPFCRTCLPFMEVPR